MYVTDDTIWSYVQTNLYTDDELQLDEASYSNRQSQCASAGQSLIQSQFALGEFQHELDPHPQTAKIRR